MTTFSRHALCHVNMAARMHNTIWQVSNKCNILGMLQPCRAPRHAFDHTSTTFTWAMEHVSARPELHLTCTTNATDQHGTQPGIELRQANVSPCIQARSGAPTHTIATPISHALVAALCLMTSTPSKTSRGPLPPQLGTEHCSRAHASCCH